MAGSRSSAPISLTRPEACFQLAEDFRTICRREAVDGRLLLAALLPLALVAPQIEAKGGKLGQLTFATRAFGILSKISLAGCSLAYC